MSKFQNTLFCYYLCLYLNIFFNTSLFTQFVLYHISEKNKVWLYVTANDDQMSICQFNLACSS